MRLSHTFISALILGGTAATVHAELVYGLLNNDTTNGQQLVTFDSVTRAVTATVKLQTPSNVGSLSTISFRPSTGQLYGFSSGTDQLYTVNPGTGALTTIGATLPGGTIGGGTMAFDPTADTIRLVGVQGGNQNIRLNPTTGGIVSTDTSLAYAPTDPGVGTTLSVGNISYTNERSGASSTTLYDIEVTRDVLTIQNPQNSGALTTVGALGFDAGATANFGTFDGFDISAQSGVGFLTDSPAGTPAFLGGPTATTTTLYTVNLTTGAATNRGLITGLPFGRSIQDIAVINTTSVPEPVSLGIIGSAAIMLLSRRRRSVNV